MKILILVKSLDGGTGTFVCDFLKIQNFFKAHQYEIKVISLEKSKYQNIKNKNVNFLRRNKFYPKHYSVSPTNFVNFFEEAMYIKEIINNFAPDIVLGIEMRCNMLAIFSKYLSKIKPLVIATTHLNLSFTTLDITQFIFRPIIKCFIKKIYQKADALVCVSGDLSNSLAEKFGISKPVITIPYGKKLKITKSRQSFLNKIIRVVTVCRLEPQKDVDNIIHAVGLLDDNCKYEVLIVGDGVEKKRLKNLVKKLNLNNKIKFLGWVKNVYKIFDRSSLFVLSSRSEGFGYVLIEAMSRGLPVVSTDTPFGPREVLDGGKYGVLVPMHNPVLLKDAICRISQHKAEYIRLSKKSIERSKFYTIDKMFESYNKLFNNLLKK